MKPVAVLLGALVFTVTVSAATPAASATTYTPPRFTETNRRDKITPLFARIDREFTDYAAQREFPGLTWGIVLDGELVHTGAVGFANVERKIPAAADTRFRIASMTKSFTALAILRLRDAGKLALHDPVAKFIPDFAHVVPLTSDAATITLRHLLTMTPGFPEDNPWGDRQLAVSPKEFAAFLTDGVSSSNAPGVTFEYSNLAYALLGQVVTRAAGEPYQAYITREILRPLGMKDTGWEFTEVPAEKLALGYRSAGSGQWQLEPLLHDGTYGAMGGLLTTVRDFARYVSLHLAAWPARNDPEDGIVRRASLREMHQPSVFTGLNANAKNLVGETVPTVSGYGFGLSWTNDSKGIVRLGHGGGLPGFGSYWRFYPEHGLAVISFANLTYAGTSAINARVEAIILDEAKLARRTLPPSAILATRAQQVAQLVQTWEPDLAQAIVAENFFPDRSREAWMTLAQETFAKLGPIQSVGEIMPENQLRGRFALTGEKGRVDVYFTLTPEKIPRLQQLRLTFVAKP